MISHRTALLLLGLAGFDVPGALAQGAKVEALTISENALEAQQEPGDRDEARDAAPAVDEGSDSALPSPTQFRMSATASRAAASACTCPRAGVWRVTNLEGWMKCEPFGIKRTDKRADKNDGAIWILNDDCSTIFSEAYEKHREDVLMDRGRDCLFFGTAPGEEDGADAIFDGAYKVETEEFITGEYHLEMSARGVSCTGFTPFEIEFLRPLSEKDYAKLETQMRKELEKARKNIDEHREQIDAYLEKTGGGKPFGGRVSGE